MAADTAVAPRRPGREAPSGASGALAPSPARDWLRLLRWKNLIIVAATQALAWGCVVWPLHDTQGLVLTPEPFLCLLLSTVCIAGAGYVINDYFDIKIDAINRPQKSILENPVHRRRALVVHLALNAVGLLLAGGVAVAAGRPLWLGWQLGTAVLLWLYSSRFKRAFAVGNVVVAFLTALSVALLALYEPVVRAAAGWPAVLPSGALNPLGVLGGFAVFAFLLTWMREIVKDAEDLKGDAAEGCDTMPIRWGLLRAARFTQMLGAVTLLALGGASAVLFQAGWWLAGAWLVAGLGLPLLAWALHLPRHATVAHYARASRHLKLLMLAGLLTLLLLQLRT